LLKTKSIQLAIFKLYSVTLSDESVHYWMRPQPALNAAVVAVGRQRAVEGPASSPGKDSL